MLRKSVLFLVAVLAAHWVLPLTRAKANEFVGPFPSWKNAKKDFGAVGDGKADDTQALQKALNTMQQGVLYLPAGTYRITAGLTMVSHQFMNVLGEDTAKTVIKWDGPDGGTMLFCNGVRYSRYGRLTWDGAGKALTAVDHEWDGKTPGADTGNEHADEVFENVGYGLRGGMPHYMDAEMSVWRCAFRHCSRAGISIESMNALDWWVWYSLFEDCKVGATNITDGEYGGGHFHVYESVFKGSTEADMTIGHTSYFGIRHNTSIGSKAFFIAKRTQFGRGAWKDNETWGAQVTMQDNTIINPVDSTPIQIYSNGPTFLLDNTFQMRADAPQAPVVKTAAPGGPSDIISIGNTYSVSNPFEVKGRLYTLDDKLATKTKLSEKIANLPVMQPKAIRPVIEVTAGTGDADIQKAIDEAAKLRGKRPVVHLPGGQYTITKTIVVPANTDLQLVGDGYSSTLQWAGQGAGPMVKVLGPSQATFSEFEMYAGPGEWKPKPDTAVGFEVKNCDQPGGRIVMSGSQAQNFAAEGVLIDRLGATEFSLYDNHVSDAGVGISVVGSNKPAGGRVAVFSGITTNNELTYDVSNGGGLLVRDTWYEGAPLRFMHLKGKGELTLSGGKIASGRPAPNAESIDPNYAGVEIDDFQGNVALISTLFSTRMNVHGEGAGTNVLVLGSSGEVQEAWTNSSPKAKVMVLDSTVQAPNGSAPAENTGPADKDAFVRKMVAQLRTGKVPAARVVKEGQTDLLFHRVWVRFGSVAYHFQAAP